MAAPVWASVNSGTRGGTAATLAIPAPSGIVVGDLLSAWLHSDTTTTAATFTATGWTATFAASTSNPGAAGNSAQHFWKIADSSDAVASTFSFSRSGGSGQWGAIIDRITGSDGVDISGVTPATGTDGISPSVTTTDVDRLVLHYLTWDEGKTFLSQPTGDTLSSTNILSSNASASAYQTFTSPGATGTAAWDLNAVTRTCAATIAFKSPAAAGGVSGSMAATETGPDTFAGAASVDVSGALAAQEAGSDTLAASGTVAVSGSLTATELGSDTFAATGTVTNAGAVTGSMSATEAGSDTFAGTGINANPITPVAPPSGGGGGFYPAQHHSFTNKDVQRIERMMFPKRRKRKPVKEIVAAIQDIAPDVSPVIIRQEVVALERSLADTPMQQDLAVLEKATKTMLEALMALQDDEDIEQILLLA